MFWAKSCELADMVPSELPESEQSSPNGFEVEFGQWCMRSTLDIIGYEVLEIRPLLERTNERYQHCGLWKGFQFIEEPRG